MNYPVTVLCLVASMLVSSGAYQLTNWMASIPDSMSLAHMAIPGTHQSGAYGKPDNKPQEIGRCQDWSIKQQLDNGIRFLDIRIANSGNLTLYGKRILTRDPNDFEIQHGKYLWFGSFKNLVMNPVKDFLAKNGRETILMSINNADILNVAKLERLFLTSNYKFYLGGTVYPTTKLGDVRGKIVLVKRYTGGNVNGISWGSMWKQDEHELDVKCKITPFGSRSCSFLYGLDYPKKARKVYDFLVKAKESYNDNHFWVNFASAHWTGMYIGNNAKVANRKVLDFFNNDRYGKVGSIIPMDYPNRMNGVIDAIIHNNFKRYVHFQSLYGEDTDGHWGTWGSAVFCPSGQFVFGYRLRTESKQGSGDDTALNDIELRCARKDFVGGYTTIWSKFKTWGDFSDFEYCSGVNNPVVGFDMKIEPPQGRGDDTAANDVDLYCQNGRYISAWTATSWGEWTTARMCASGWAVHGIATRVEDDQGGGRSIFGFQPNDDTALNGVRMYCKPY